MMKFFLLQNGLAVTEVKREVDTYVPLMVHLEYEKIISYDSKYISLDSENNSVEINIGAPFGEIYNFSCINRKPIILNSQLDRSTLINKPMSAPSIMAKKINQEGYQKINGKVQLYFFNDCLLLAFNRLNEACYNFLINEKLSIITNKKYEISAFLFDEITEKEKLKLKTFIKFSTPKLTNQNQIRIRGQMNLPIKKNIVQTIMQLNNIDTWEFLYNGLQKKIISNDFIIYFAEKSLEANYSSDLSVTIAGLLKDEHFKVKKILEKKYKDSSTNTDKLYNEIWFYICSLQNMYNQNIL